MRTVAHIITALRSGGAERVLYLPTTCSSPAPPIRHVVIALADEGFYGAALRNAGIEVHTLGMRNNRLAFAALLRLIKLLRAIRPDVVMTWLYHADLLGTIAGRLAGIRRIVWNLRCSDFVFAEHPPMTGRIVSLLARLSPLPVAIATNSIAGQRAHAALGFHPKRWIYLPNGFDTSEWAPHAADRVDVRRELGVTDEQFLVGRIGRVDPQKDLPNFLAAVERAAEGHPRMRLLLVGENTDQLKLPHRLRGVTQALGVRRDVPRLMRALDILVSSSAYGEGLPNVVAEAMASGVPCVVTDVGDSAVLVGDEGLVVPARNPTALAHGIEALMAMPADDLAAMGLRARDRVKTNYSIASFLRRYAHLFSGNDGI